MLALSRVGRFFRDLCLIALGFISLLSTPPSVAAGLTVFLTYVWAVLLVVAGIVCVLGWLLERPVVEIVGCLFAAVAFATWMVAAVTQEDTTTASWQVALLLLAGIAGQVYRIAEVARTARWVIVP